MNATCKITSFKVSAVVTRKMGFIWAVEGDGHVLIDRSDAVDAIMITCL